MDCLGDEILTEILSRLPVKSLMQLKCINKQFNSMISCPFFAKQQLMRSLKHGQKLFLTSSPLLSVDVEKWNVVTVKQDATTALGYLTNISNKRTKILGSCHGLICMVFSFRKWVLLNPATREFIEIPKPKKHGFKSIPEKFFGFGYDSSTDDYKLLRGTCSLEERSPNELPPSLEILSFKSGKWRQIKEIPEYHILGNINRIGTYYNGCMYWLTEDATHHYGVVSFDLTTEEFGEVVLPEFDYHGEGQFHLEGLSCLDGHLLLFGAVRKRYIAGWILMELNGRQTWKNVYNHSMREEPAWGFTSWVKVLGITGDGKIVANACIVNWSAMQYYDPNTDKYTYEHVVVMLGRPRHYIDSGVYVETLVSPRSIFRQIPARMKLRPMRKKMLRPTI